MKSKALIRRHLTVFGLDLVWTGKEVLVTDGNIVLETYEAKTGRQAGVVMDRVEEECFEAASAMC